MNRRSHDDPWVMRVLAFLIADDAAKEHAARPHRTASPAYSIRVVYRKPLLARSKCRCLRRIRIKVDSHSSVSSLTPSRIKPWRATLRRFRLAVNLVPTCLVKAHFVYFYVLSAGRLSSCSHCEKGSNSTPLSTSLVSRAFERRNDKFRLTVIES